MYKECPCYDTTTKQDCPKRYVGCHAKCTEYVDWASSRKSERDKQNVVREANNQIISTYQERKARQLRKRARWRKYG